MEKGKLTTYRLAVTLLVLVSVATLANAQHTWHWSLRNDLAYDATRTPNLGLDVRVDSVWQFGVVAGYCPKHLGDSGEKRWRHILISPELRHWNSTDIHRYAPADSTWKRHATFWGLNLVYSHYNAGMLKFPFGLYPSAQDIYKQGDLWALGAFYGYSHRLNRLFRLEAAAGVGVGYTNYDRHDCDNCLQGSGDKVFLLPKLSVNIVLDPAKKEPRERP